MALHRKQLSLIHIAKHRLGLAEDDYRAILQHIGGVDSARELDAFGFGCVMDYFARLGFRSDWRARHWGDRPGMASASQTALIRHLWAEYTDGAGDDLSLGKWLARTFKVSALRFLPAGLAPKVITALKAMQANKARRAEAQRVQA